MRLTWRNRQEEAKAPTARFVVQAGPDTPFTVRFEPQGTQLELAPGDYVIVEWPLVEDGEPHGGVVHAPDGLTLTEPGGGAAGVWDSRGRKLDILGR
ncbi:hypothetical protein ACFWUQ_22270 [Streptomyces sp. NPDC058662]|uniref:hypothetical protein n=1 Tax=Streptomyces sp. NPDC058662 TaxID=3346583 RepID=UPI0036548D78